ncbi:hypothetical protein PMI41_01002 [Phyllobacterium sp. YR531]|nr:hypothetical protein PMI41_01002 [Phyllobacterium sp. YR531]
MMNGHADGLDDLDFSEDGFWQSFHAITISLPPLILGWIALANDVASVRPQTGSRLSTIGSAAFIDLAVWVLPIVILAFLAGPLGIAKRFSPYVVASNWGSVIGSWLTAPATLVRTLLPEWPALVASINLAIYAVIVILTYRLVHVALKKSYLWSAGFFLVLIIGSILMVVTLQNALGIFVPAVSG